MRSAIIAIAVLAASPTAAVEQFSVQSMGDIMVFTDLCENIDVNWPAVNAELSAISLKPEELIGEGAHAQEMAGYMVQVQAKIKEIAEREGFELGDFACYLAANYYGPRGSQIPYLIWLKAAR